MKEQVERISHDPAALEGLFRQALQRGQQEQFRAAIAQCCDAAPDNVLLRAWACRFDPSAPSVGDLPAERVAAGGRRHWATALALAVGSGVLFALFAGDREPIPIPAVASPLFWIGWAPLTALVVVAFGAIASPQRQRLAWQVGAAVVAVVVGLTSAAVAWGRTDDVAVLLALHLPFVAWAVIGGAVSLGRADRAREVYSHTVRSLETLVTGGIFFGASLVFVGLTGGLLEVFGIRVPEEVLRFGVSFAIGAIPVLAVAAIYDPAVSPARQRPTGVARILRIMTWLFLPAALGVLALYVLWLIPVYFWRPFEERSILIVYNVTIMAILAFLAGASAATEAESSRVHYLRPALVSLTALTLLLNAYALAAIVSRTLAYGLTPNRHVVLGWNSVTLCMLAFLLVTTWSAAADEWLPRFRESFGRAMVLPVAWTLWVIWVVPLF